MLVAARSDRADGRRLGAVAAALGLAAGSSATAAASSAGAGAGAALPSAGAAGVTGAGAMLAWRVGIAVVALVVATTGTWVGLKRAATDPQHETAPAPVGSVATPTPAPAPEPAPPQALPVVGRTAGAPLPATRPIDSSSRQGRSEAPAMVPAPARPAATGAATPTTEPAWSAAAPEVPPPAAAAPATELELLRAAEDAIRSDPASALRLADEHAARFPRGMLTQESEVIAIEALVRLGRKDEAQARAQMLLREFPGTAHRVRVEALLANPRSGSPHNP
jgi:hypothetical protein